MRGGRVRSQDVTNEVISKEMLAASWSSWDIVVAGMARAPSSRFAPMAQQIFIFIIINNFRNYNHSTIASILINNARAFLGLVRTVHAPLLKNTCTPAGSRSLRVGQECHGHWEVRGAMRRGNIRSDPASERGGHRPEGVSIGHPHTKTGSGDVDDTHQDKTRRRRRSMRSSSSLWGHESREGIEGAGTFRGGGEGATRMRIRRGEASASPSTALALLVCFVGGSGGASISQVYSGMPVQGSFPAGAQNMQHLYFINVTSGTWGVSGGTGRLTVVLQPSGDQPGPMSLSLCPGRIPCAGEAECGCPSQWVDDGSRPGPSSLRGVVVGPCELKDGMWYLAVR